MPLVPPLASCAGLAALALAVVASPVSAVVQTPDWDHGGLEVSRSALESLLAQYESVVR